MTDLAVYSQKAISIPRHFLMLSERLDYTWDFTDDLDDVNDTINSYVLTIATLGQYQSAQASSKKVVSFIAGAAGVIGQSYLASCKITTVEGRIFQRDRWLQIVSSR